MANAISGCQGKAKAARVSAHSSLDPKLTDRLQEVPVTFLKERAELRMCHVLLLGKASRMSQKFAWPPPK